MMAQWVSKITHKYVTTAAKIMLHLIKCLKFEFEEYLYSFTFSYRSLADTIDISLAIDKNLCPTFQKLLLKTVAILVFNEAYLK